MGESAAKCMYLVDPDMYNNILGITSHKLITKKKVNNGVVHRGSNIKINSNINQTGEYKNIHQNIEPDHKNSEEPRPSSNSDQSRSYDSTIQPNQSPNPSKRFRGQKLSRPETPKQSSQSGHSGSIKDPKHVQTPESPMEYEENSLPPLPKKYEHPNAETISAFFSNKKHKKLQQNRKNILINKKIGQIPN